MRFVAPLSEPAKLTLNEMQKYHPKTKARMRAHMVLLSATGSTIDEIAQIYQVQRNTVSDCFTRWQTAGIVGLLDRPRSGRPRLLQPHEEERAIDLLAQDPRNSKKAQSLLQAETGKQISQWTFKRSVKRAGLRWKRLRRTLKNKQDARALAAGKAELVELQQQAAQGAIALYYFDESGVSTVPVVPYGWQAAGETVAIPTQRGKRTNILGFYGPNNDFYYETYEGWVTSEQVITCFDSFAARIQQPTVVVLDNASIHTSTKFKACCAAWAEKGLTIHYLPAYSPELNLIEILWRFLKYTWLPLSAYQSYKQLRHCLINVLDRIGTEYTISFA